MLRFQIIAQTLTPFCFFEFWRPVHALTARVELDMLRGAIGNSKGKVRPTTGHEGGGGGGGGPVS